MPLMREGQSLGQICRSKPTTSTNDSPKQPKSQLSKRQHGYRKGTRKVHNIEAGQADGDSDFDVLTFSDIMVSSMKSSRDEAFVTVNVKLTSRPGIHNLILKVDTGAQGNTLPLATFRRMFPDKLDSRLFYYLIREIKMWQNMNCIRVHNNTYLIF